MFGGLELKGGANSTGTSDNTTNASPTNSSSGSAFGFLNSFAADPVGATASASSFSFLYGESSNAAPNDADASVNFLQPAEPLSNKKSAFSFLMGETAPSPSAEATAKESNHTVTATSSFAFLQEQTTVRSSTLSMNSESSASSIPEPESMSADAIAAAANETSGDVGGVRNTSSSGFSFLSPSPPKSILGAAITTESLGMTKASSEAPYGSSVAGAGVTFGTNAAATATGGAKTIKKKRTRTAIVGVKAHQNSSIDISNSNSSDNASKSQRQLEQQYQQTPSQEGDLKTRESALEASRRAEAFMAEKIKLEASQTSRRPNEGDVPISTFQTLSAIGSVDSEDSDGIVATARAAAEEAHKMSNEGKIMKAGSSSLLSGLFRVRTSPPASRHNSSRTLSGGGSGSVGGATPPPLQANMRKNISTTSSSAESTQILFHKSSDAMTATEKLREEQEQVQRRMSDQHQRIENTGEQGQTVAELAYEHKSKPIAVVPVPLPPSKHPTVVTTSSPIPKDKFNSMISQFRDRVERAMNEVSRLRQHRIGLMEEQHVTIAKERLASQQKAAAEAQQMAAAEAEEFEVADQMSFIIEKYERETIEYKAVVDNIKAALLHLEIQKQQCTEQVASLFRDVRADLIEFQKLTEADDSKDAMEKLQQFSAVSKVLSAEHERLQQDWKHIERDLQQVNEERKEVETAISLQSGEFEKARDTAYTKLSVVEEEIAELRRQLAAKQEVAAKLRTEAAGHEEAILKVRVKFARQLTRVQKKEMEIQDSQKEWESEKLNLDTQRQSHEIQMSAHSEAMLERDRLLDKLHKEIDLATAFEAIFVSKDMSFFEAPHKELQKDGNNDDGRILAQLQADVVEAEASKNDSQIALKAASSALANLEEERKRLDGSIPALEEMKKTAASRRDFKMAGHASKEIKEATARLKHIQDELLDEAREKVELAEKEFERRSIQLQNVTELAREKELQFDVESMYAIAEAIQKLMKTKESCCDMNKTGENATKTESIQSVGAFVLDCQIRAFRLEGQALGDKVGSNRWGEVLNEVVGNMSFVDEGSSTKKGDATDEGAVKENVHPDSKENEGSLNEEKTELAATEASKITATSSIMSPSHQTSSTIERMSRFLVVTKSLKDVEDELEKAVADEDFDQAAVLDEKLQELMNDLTELNMSDEEMELALANYPTFNDGDVAPDIVDTELLTDVDKVDDVTAPSIIDSTEETKDKSDGRVPDHDEEEMPANVGRTAEDTKSIEVQSPTIQEATVESDTEFANGH